MYIYTYVYICVDGIYDTHMVYIYTYMHTHILLIYI